MLTYNDEDMLQKKQFVNNIPYLRDLDEKTIHRILYLMKEQVYQ